MAGQLQQQKQHSSSASRGVRQQQEPCWASLRLHSSCCSTNFTHHLEEEELELKLEYGLHSCSDPVLLNAHACRQCITRSSACQASSFAQVAGTTQQVAHVSAKHSIPVTFDCSKPCLSMMGSVRTDRMLLHVSKRGCSAEENWFVVIL